MKPTSKTFHALLSFGAATSTVVAAGAQEINLGVGCSGFEPDVDTVLRTSVDPAFLLGAMNDEVIEETNFDSADNWSMLGGYNNAGANVASPYGKFLLGYMLVEHGVAGQAVPVTQEPNDFFVYDDEAFYLTPNHNLDREYRRLLESESRMACVDVDVNTGDPLCVDREPDGWSIWARAYVSNAYYGELEIVRLRAAFDSPNVLANYEGSASFVQDPLGDHRFTIPGYNFYFAHAINYGCPTFDSNRGVARVSGTMVHENFHGTSFIGHEDCDRGEGACAKEWDFDAPLSPRIHNGIALNRGTDAYQIEQRFMCDIVDSPEDWVPLMVQQVMNARANDRADQNIYLNITRENPTGGAPLPWGRAPLSCGIPSSMLGRLAVTCGLADQCDAATPCGAGDLCFSGCCVPQTCGTAGGTTCVDNGDCGALEVCGADSCCAPAACQNPNGSIVCSTPADCRADEICTDGCCYPRPV